MKLFCIVEMSGGLPRIDFEATPYTGYVHAASVGPYGAYLFSGTQAQLKALNALAQVIGILMVTETETQKWPELSGKSKTGELGKLNGWLSSHGFGQIPPGRLYRDAISEVYKRFNPAFDLSGFDVKDVDA